jgi:hypothetical protein
MPISPVSQLSQALQALRVPRGRRYATALAALTLAAGSLGVTTAAAAGTAAEPIAPHQWFAGQVNGATADAVIKVACFGPVSPYSTGHPVAGQSVAVAPALAWPSASETGYTGDLADRVRVDFGNPVSVGSPTVLGAYHVKAEIPTSIDLPCYGTGKVAFVPLPTSASARTAVVAVSYVNIGL